MIKTGYNRFCAALLALSIAAAGAAGLDKASAYLTSHAETSGYVSLDLEDTYTRLEDNVANWEKKVSIVNTGDADCEVRAKFFVAAKYAKYIKYSSDSARWTLDADGYWYYDGVLEPGDATAVLSAKLDREAFSRDFKAGDTEDFNVIVVHEYARVQYDDSGNGFVDWNEKVVIE